MGEQRFRINAENVVHETIDGEVIAIDLGSGSYYSLSGSAPVVWELLETGAAAAEIGAALAARYAAEPGTIEAAVEDLLTRLRENGLIVVAETAVPPQVPEPAEQRGDFVAPVFELYTDMKDYFLLDPIHEVNPTGWPKPAS